ncbi:MAG: MYG1 family protein [Dehalococcoidales bacterium]|nr:MYG1 family protein [Dehalococcoidales bacterium]
MKAQLIITHPGSAHFDEITAIGLILATHTDELFTIERREPVPAELDNPAVWIIDIGNRHEPEKRNFDHHQEINCPVAFVLVAKYLGLLETMSVMPWWNFKDSVDRIGPTRSSTKYHAGDYLVNQNPVESWLVARFAFEPETSLPLLKAFGTHIIDSARKLKKQIDFWKTSTRIVIAGLPAIIGETRESAGLEEFRRMDTNPPDIVISLDRRDNGWRLYRYDGTPVDFSLISDYPAISFAHKSGFMAKTKERLAIDDLIALVSKAVIGY